MKKFRLLIPVILIVFSSCDKLVEETQRDLLMSELSKGYWVITSFVEDSNNITDSFRQHKFIFDQDGGVLSQADSLEENGTWTGNIDTWTIVANFPTAGDPVRKLNGSWSVITYNMDQVKASKKRSNGADTLVLQQKE